MALRVFVDFHNADPQGRVRLNTVGGIKDLAGFSLSPGTLLELYDGEIELKGTAAYSSEEKIWAAVVDWGRFSPP